MKHLARHGFTVVATGAVALALSSCGMVSEAMDDAEAGTTLDCKDLSDEVWEQSPDENLTLMETPEADYDKLAGWMADNGKNFSDEKLGEAVTTYGKLAPDYYKFFNDIDPDALSDSDITKYEDASTAIDGECKDLGFGFDE